MAAVVIGAGLLATAFRKAAEEMQDVCIFASGVANSACVDDAEFMRERDLLEKALTASKDISQFVYFGTCSVYDPASMSSAYVKHKQRMEQLVLQQDRTHVFRLPQLAGRSKNTATLLNFLSISIENQVPIKVWSNAERNIIDVEDVVNAVRHCIKEQTTEAPVINICSPQQTRILEIVGLLEKIKNKSTHLNIIEGGCSYQIPFDDAKEIYDKIGLEFPSNYLEKVLRKYYS